MLQKYCFFLNNPIIFVKNTNKFGYFLKTQYLCTEFSSCSGVLPVLSG